MKSTLLIILGIAVGWFLNAALTNACEGKDWRDPAKWAAIGLFDIAGVLVVSNWF